MLNGRQRGSDFYLFEPYRSNAGRIGHGAFFLVFLLFSTMISVGGGFIGSLFLWTSVEMALDVVSAQLAKTTVISTILGALIAVGALLFWLRFVLATTIWLTCHGLGAMLGVASAVWPPLSVQLRIRWLADELERLASLIMRPSDRSR